MTYAVQSDELVDVSEKLNGFDHNGDGEPDWGFCLTPQTNYFNAFVAPVLQTHLRECTKSSSGEVTCNTGAHTGQNIFFDADNFEPLIYNVSLISIVYTRLIHLMHDILFTATIFLSIRMDSSTPSRCTGALSAPQIARRRVSMAANAIARLLSQQVVVQESSVCLVLSLAFAQ